MTEHISYTYGPVFDRLWAVVAYESIDTARISGQWLLWSPEHQAWRRAYNYGAAGFSPEPTSAQPDAEYVASALAMLDRTGDNCPYAPRRRKQCGQPIEGDHFVAPGVCSEPVLYCVQRPDKDGRQLVRRQREHEALGVDLRLPCSQEPVLARRRLGRVGPQGTRQLRRGHGGIRRARQRLVQQVRPLRRAGQRCAVRPGRRG